MMLKKKNIYVIIVTVFIVFLVILSSFFGLIIYLQYRQLNLASKYYETLERLDTISYAKNVEVNSLKIRHGFKGLPLVEGQIKNKGKRTVTSIAIKVNFFDSLNTPIYSYTIYPLEPIRQSMFFKNAHFTNFIFLKENTINPNSSTIFKSVLWQCPRRLRKMLIKNSFSNNRGEWCGKIAGEVVNIRLKPV